MPTTIRVSDLGARLPRWRGLLFEKHVYGFQWVALDDKPLLFGSGLILLAFWFCFLRHRIQLSHRFLSGDEMVPQPGIEPGRPDWARGCKPRLSANSSTGARCKKPLNAGTVTPVQGSPVPALFGPISAALNPSSLSVLRKFHKTRCSFVLPLFFLAQSHI